MMLWVVGVCLLGGASLCLLAAMGVLRLPDVFMRMHAATKSGVVGCGLILVGVAVADGSVITGVKCTVATVFLLLTTPVAGHLLGRAAYVSGAPFWRGTIHDQLEQVLPRRHFGPSGLRGPSSTMEPTTTLQGGQISKVLIALAQGPCMDVAIGQAVALARRHGAELCGIAIIDLPRLSNVGLIQLGANTQAAEFRQSRTAMARQAAANVIQSFEAQAKGADVKWSVRVEEGRPHVVLRSLQEPGCVVAVAPGGWFDQGVLQRNVNVARRLVSGGVYPILVLGATSEKVHRVRFVHDGSDRSSTTWRWLLEADLWPEATLVIGVLPGAEWIGIEQVLQETRRRGRRLELGDSSRDPQEYVVIGNAGSRGWLPGWLVRQRPSDDKKVLAIG